MTTLHVSAHLFHTAPKHSNHSNHSNHAEKVMQVMQVMQVMPKVMPIVMPKSHAERLQISRQGCLVFVKNGPNP